MDYNKKLDELLSKRFSGLQLKNPLFYNALVSIRFELGGNLSVTEGRAERVTHRAVTLFFVDSWDEHPVYSFKNDVHEIFFKYASKVKIKNISKVEQEYRYKDTSDNDDTMTIRYCTRVKVYDLKVESLLEAIVNRKTGAEQSIRGLDVVADKTETLRTSWWLHIHMYKIQIL